MPASGRTAGLIFMSHTTLSRRHTLTRIGTLALGSGLLLAGCSAEPKERKAFIAFLQSDALGKSRRMMPGLSEKMRKELGSYAAHYDIMVRFNQTVNDKNLLKNMRELQWIRTPAQYFEKRETLKLALAEIPQAQATVQTELKKADEAKAALNQPEDLKKAYDPIYERLVSAPARLLLEMMPPMQRLLNVVTELLTLVEKNPQQLSITGIHIEAKSQAMLDKVNALFKKADAETQALQRIEKELKEL